VVPRLNFACELASADLTALFADGSVIGRLVDLGASVSLGLIDLSPERAAVIRRLNTSGIPVTAWLLLPMDQGYWFNVNTASLATARYAAFRAWTEEHGLVWDRIGLDLEPDTREIKRLLANRWTLIPSLLRRVVDDRARTVAAREFAALVASAHADGYRVDSYVLPFLEDELAVGASLLHRLLGLVDVGADRQLPMLYTSFMGSRGVGLLWSYGRRKRAIIVGSTGGGVPLGGTDQARPLDWAELSRDLRLAHRLGAEIAIYSLEGCVAQAFLEPLQRFDWDAPVALPSAAGAAVDRWRAVARGALWVTKRPYVLPVLPAVCLALLPSRRRRGQRANPDVRPGHP